MGSGSPRACLQAQVTRSHGSCSRHRGTKPSGSRSSGATCQAWDPGVQYSSTAGMGEPSLGAAGALGPASHSNIFEDTGIEVWEHIASAQDLTSLTKWLLSSPLPEYLAVLPLLFTSNCLMFYASVFQFSLRNPFEHYPCERPYCKTL
jgi:hypothetical protein